MYSLSRAKIKICLFSFLICIQANGNICKDVLVEKVFKEEGQLQLATELIERLVPNKKYKLVEYETKEGTSIDGTNVSRVKSLNPYFIPYVYFHFLLKKTPTFLKDVSKQMFVKYYSEAMGFSESSKLDQKSLKRSLKELEKELNKSFKNQDLIDSALVDVERLQSMNLEGVSYSIRNHRRKGELSEDTFLKFLDASKNSKNMRKMQKKNILTSMKRANEIIDAETSEMVLNEYLWTFYAVHQFAASKTGFRHFWQRKWMNPKTKEKANPKDIKLEQVENMPVDLFAQIIIVSMEIEDPIMEYSYQSGNAFSTLLPTMGRFMGKNLAEKIATENRGRKQWCESPWCAEEKRHGNALASTIEKLVGFEPYRGNPNEVAITNYGEKGARKHLDSRMATEWGASTAYALLASHAKDNLKEWISNILRDEIKHLAIMSAADKYLYGTRPNNRVYRMMKRVLELSLDHNQNRSSGGVFTDMWVVMEAANVLIRIEKNIRSWMEKLPLSTLRYIFENDSKIDNLERAELPQETRMEIEALMEANKKKRASLEMWPKKQRDQAFGQLLLEEVFLERGIKDSVKNWFNDFKGVEKMELSDAVKWFEDIFYQEEFQRTYNMKNEAQQNIVKKIFMDKMMDYRIKNNPLMLEFEQIRDND